MAYITNRTPGAGSITQAGLLGRILQSLGSAATAAMAAHRNRQIVRQLASYDDHLLRDMGLTRQDVISALDGPLTDDPALFLARARRNPLRAARHS